MLQTKHCYRASVIIKRIVFELKKRKSNNNQSYYENSIIS